MEKNIIEIIGGEKQKSRPTQQTLKAHEKLSLESQSGGAVVEGDTSVYKQPNSIEVICLSP